MPDPRQMTDSELPDALGLGESIDPETGETLVTCSPGLTRAEAEALLAEQEARDAESR